MSETAALVVWLLGIVAWAAIRLPHQRRARKQGVAAHKRSRRDRLALLAASVGLVALPALHLAFGLFRFADHAYRPWMGVVGLLIEAAFLALFYATHRQLGKNWSVTLELRPEHRLVTEGLYRHVRHPMYSSFWLWALAQAFLIPNWIAGLSGLAGVALLYFSRLNDEENLMRSRFGAEYDAYAARTGRLFPRFTKG